MPRRNVSLLREPRGDVYRDLIRIAPRWADRAGLVLRDLGDATYASRMEPVLEPLRDDILSRRAVTEWPGTQLFSEEIVELVEFRLVPEGLEYLTRIARGLYSWKFPALPEDLHFMRSAGTPWLVSIAHERDAYFVIDELEQAELVQALPWLDRRLRVDSADSGE